MQNVTPVAIAALGLELAPAIVFGLAGEQVVRAMGRWPAVVRVSVPALFVAPYVLVSISQHMFRWEWFALYAALPIAWMLMRAAAADTGQRGNWQDWLIL